ncbi:hypothetical protein EDC02_3519 [Micromonospora sp. Llam0]|uniref:hypothetical protein n=1 Tax=Micromonospora sp. Llam0 TaxID=2485143 RepID=UPI000F924D1F|nr:hypothetical protein [Micromonospora sp. Llam0]ROO61579.1 hypothetical protein EDC02_3519 [Micromonospora sp. Llam0]
MSRLPGKRAWPVLRGPRRSNAPGLPDELVFSILTRRLLRRGEFTSREHLANKIIKYFTHYNRTAKPFRWTYDGRPLKAA